MAKQDDSNTIWVMSNRVDDRVVLFERDPAHPGGQAFVGGDSVDHVARTGAVEQLLRAGLLVEIPEPPDGPKKPRQDFDNTTDQFAAQPGQSVRLGRTPNPALVPPGAQADVAKQQKQLPNEIPSQAEVAPAG